MARGVRPRVALRAPGLRPRWLCQLPQRCRAGRRKRGPASPGKRAASMSFHIHPGMSLQPVWMDCWQDWTGRRQLPDVLDDPRMRGAGELAGGLWRSSGLRVYLGGWSGPGRSACEVLECHQFRDEERRWSRMLWLGMQSGCWSGACGRGTLQSIGRLKGSALASSVIASDGSPNPTRK